MEWGNSLSFAILDIPLTQYMHFSAILTLSRPFSLLYFVVYSFGYFFSNLMWLLGDGFVQWIFYRKTNFHLFAVVCKT